MIITRFAPSPTGYLHIGGLRTALYCYLWARKNNGKFLLRIEDTDLKRNSQAAAVAIKDAFEWTNLHYDGDIFYQSERFDIYKKFIKQLLDEQKAYKCYMSKDELDELRATQMANKQRPRYDGRYRDFKGEPPAGIEPVIRIKAPLFGKIEFEDGVKGKMSFEADDILDDFIIARSDGSPTYNFVVAVDDALMGVNEVIRGDDHLSNTPKQIIIYKALGFNEPKFYHVPMINNESGKKLSKRDGAMDVMEYKSLGFLPEALINFLVRLGWGHKDQEIFSLEEMINLFDPNDINSSASSYNTQKLLWLNSHYIDVLDEKRLIEELKFFDVDLSNFNNANLLINSLRQRSKTLLELKDGVKSIISSPEIYDPKAMNKFINEDAYKTLVNFLKTLENTANLNDPKDYENLVNEFLKEQNLELKNLAQPIRIALTGGTQSPSVYELLAIVGKDEITKRIIKFIPKDEA